jgi:hypothetical protein
MAAVDVEGGVLMENSTNTRKVSRWKNRASAIAVVVGLGAAAALVGNAGASQKDPTRPIAINQTDGYGNGKVTVFTYGQNYQCVHEPMDDRNHNGVPAASDPSEFQQPICHVASDVNIDPAGKPAGKTEPLYVIVPFFDADHDGEAAAGLAPTLKSVFGFVPDAFDPTPGEAVQCPEPGGNLSAQKGEFGTCTMHPSTLDYGAVLHAARPDLFPTIANVKLPTVNHSHIIDGTNFGPIWWRITVVLVTDPSVWPDVNGTKGITSVDALRKAQAAGKAGGDVPTNFFLFFNAREMKMPMGG